MFSRRDSLMAMGAAGAAGLVPRLGAGASAGGGNFRLSGCYLNAAYTHPLPLDAAAAMTRYRDEATDPAAPAPAPADQTPGASELFAKLINAAPEEIAMIPSTSYGESFVIGALGLADRPGVGIVTDILHFDGGLYAYAQLAKRGADVTVLPMTAAGTIDMAALEAAVTPRTRLVAISLVSMVNGFQHDLARVCQIAHARGARVYVDAVQGAGAVPIDVRASGVDFLACGSFKWLMGDFGCGFLFVRKDRLPELRRAEFGYHQIETFKYNSYLAGPVPLYAATAAPGAVGMFEVGSLGGAAEAAVTVSLGNILRMGVEAIQRHRQPLIDRLYDQLGRDYRPMTPAGSTSPILTFWLPDAHARLAPRLRAAGVHIQTYGNRFRISPSIYNQMEDVDRLIHALRA